MRRFLIHPHLPISPSPYFPISLFPYLPISLSPYFSSHSYDNSNFNPPSTNLQYTARNYAHGAAHGSARHADRPH